MLEVITVVLAAGVAGGYFAIAALIVPRIHLENATPRFVRAFRIGGLAFFIGCGLTHTHIAYHALSDDARADWHEVVFHLMQVVGVWVFVYAAVRFVDVRVVRRKTASEEQAEELERRVADLSRSNADLEQFARVVAHDLQEPLRTVSGFAELVARRYEGRLDDAADESLRHIVDGSIRMGTLLEGILAYSRIAAVELERRPVDLDDVVATTVESLGRSIEERGASVTWGDLPTVEGDRVALSQLLQNLLANAVKFGSAGGPHVSVSAERGDGEWVVAVEDDGPGIPPGEREAIFAMFRRSASGVGQPGTGLGLAIARKIADRHGGRLWVEDAPAGGSVFRFALPIREPVVPAVPGLEARHAALGAS